MAYYEPLMYALLTPYILFSLYAGFAGSTTAGMPTTATETSTEHALRLSLAQVAHAQEISSAHTTSTAPTMELSSYFAVRGSSMKATVKSFEPREWVVLKFGTEARAQQLTDTHGNTEFAFDAPRGGISFEVTVEGLDSGTTIGRIAKLTRNE